MSRYYSSEKSPLLNSTTSTTSTTNTATGKVLYYKKVAPKSRNSKNSVRIDSNVSVYEIERNDVLFSDDIIGEIFSFLVVDRIELLDLMDSKELVSNLSALARFGTVCRQFRYVTNKSQCWEILFQHYAFFSGKDSYSYHGLAPPVLYYKAERIKMGDDFILSQCQKKQFVMYGIMFDYILKRQLFSSQFLTGVLSKTILSIDFKQYPQRNIIRATKSSRSHIDPQFAKRITVSSKTIENTEQETKINPGCEAFIQILCNSLFGVHQY